MYSLARRTLSRNFWFRRARANFQFRLTPAHLGGKRGKPRLYVESGLPSFGELALDSSDVAQGAIIGLTGRFGGYVGGGDDVDLVAEVVEGEHAVEEHENAVGNVEVVLGFLADILQLANNVVGAIADSSGGKRRQPFNLGGTVLVEQFLDDLEDAGGASFDSWD